LARLRADVYIHPSADVSDSAEIGPGTKIWNQVQVRESAVVGSECILGKGTYVDIEVTIGDRCKLENGVFVFRGGTLQDGVFLGPGVMLLNDRNPRAVNPDGSLKTAADWKVSPTVVETGASVGGGAIVLPGVRIGHHALVGSGAVVTRDVPGQGVVYGNPARLHGFACVCGSKLVDEGERGDAVPMVCPACGRTSSIPATVYRRAARD
jgi:UDP-2-acetamido-3-amino-2,3-dideoxy-glucuronate N-acetyltransferase